MVVLNVGWSGNFSQPRNKNDCFLNLIKMSVRDYFKHIRGIAIDPRLRFKINVVTGWNRNLALFFHEEYAKYLPLWLFYNYNCARWRHFIRGQETFSLISEPKI